jgi:hypothetical protein
LLVACACADSVYQVHGPLILKDGQPTVLTGVNAMFVTTRTRLHVPPPLLTLSISAN